MKPAWKWVSVAFIAALVIGAAATTWAAPQEQQQQKPNYTLAEYNAYQAAHNEKDPQMRLKALDDFSMKFPGSALMLYIDGDYYRTYYAVKNYPKTIEYVDKILALPDLAKPEQIGTKLEALGYRAQAMLYGSGEKDLQTPEAYTKAKEASAQGLQTLNQWQKPQGNTDEQFANTKKGLGVLFNSVAGIAESGLKDYKSAGGFLQGRSGARSHRCGNTFPAGRCLSPRDARRCTERILGTFAFDRLEGAGRTAGADLSSQPTAALPAAILRQAGRRRNEPDDYARGNQHRSSGILDDSKFGGFAESSR